jgi:hypothetical protein
MCTQRLGPRFYRLGSKNDRLSFGELRTDKPKKYI